MEKRVNKELEGQIEDKTSDSIKIGKVWIKFFDSDKLKEICEDDYVKVTYQDNEKNGKTYHNGKEITLVKKELTSEHKEFKISDSTLNTLIMTIKEVYLNNMTGLTYDQVTDTVLESYNKIKRLS